MCKMLFSLKSFNRFKISIKCILFFSSFTRSLNVIVDMLEHCLTILKLNFVKKPKKLGTVKSNVFLIFTGIIFCCRKAWKTEHKNLDPIVVSCCCRVTRADSRIRRVMFWRWVANLEGYGWLSCREMFGQVRGWWVANLEGDGWLSWREMGG